MKQQEYAINSLWPTPIYESAIVNNFEEVQHELDECLAQCEFSTSDIKRYPHLISDPTFSENLIEKYNLKYFKEELTKHIDNYTREVGYAGEPNFYICNSWFALFKKGMWGRIHHHSPSAISGVYYHRTNGADASLFFKCPDAAMTASSVFGELAEFKGCPPRDGMLLLFPSYLEHGIVQHDGDLPRISLSFNINHHCDHVVYRL